MKKIFIILLLLSSKLFAVVQQDADMSMGIFNDISKKPRNHFCNELQYRYNFDQDGMQQVLARPGVVYRQNEQQELGLLGGYILTRNFKSKTHSHEYRLTQQYRHFFQKWHWNFQFRGRFEQRVLEKNSELSLRARPMLRASKEYRDNISWVAWNEFFFHVLRQDWAGDRWIDRNRLFIGVNIKHARFNYDIGYMNQYVPRRNQDDIIEHVLNVNFFH